jgi:hypothetical protein
VSCVFIYAESYYPKCRYAKCHNAECCGAFRPIVTWQNDVWLVGVAAAFLRIFEEISCSGKLHLQEDKNG